MRTNFVTCALPSLFIGMYPIFWLFYFPIFESLLQIGSCRFFRVWISANIKCSIHWHSLDGRQWSWPDFSCCQPNHHVKPKHTLPAQFFMRPECFTATSFWAGAPWDSFSNHREDQGSSISTFLTSLTNFTFLLLYSDPRHQMEMHRFCKGTYLLSGVVSFAFLRCLCLIAYRQAESNCISNLACWTAELTIAFIFSYFNFMYWTFTWTSIFWFANKFSFFPDSSRKNTKQLLFQRCNAYFYFN